MAPAKSGDANTTCQVVGAAPLDLVFVPGSITSPTAPLRT